MAEYLWINFGIDYPHRARDFVRTKDSVKYIRADIVQGAVFQEPASLKKLKEVLEASE